MCVHLGDEDSANKRVMQTEFGLLSSTVLSRRTCSEHWAYLASSCAHITECVLTVERQRQGSDFENKRLGRAVEATLERLYEESRRPSDDMLQSVLQLHKGVPRRKLVDWFGQRRRMDAAMQSNSPRQQRKQHS